MRLPFRAELIPPIAYFEMRQAGGLTDNWLKHRPYSKQSIDGCGTNFQTRKIRENSGGGAVWLARLLGVQEAGSSNLLPPTIRLHVLGYPEKIAYGGCARRTLSSMNFRRQEAGPTCLLQY